MIFFLLNLGHRIDRSICSPWLCTLCLAVVTLQCRSFPLRYKSAAKVRRPLFRTPLDRKTSKSFISNIQEISNEKRAIEKFRLINRRYRAQKKKPRNVFQKTDKIKISQRRTRINTTLNVGDNYSKTETAMAKIEKEENHPDETSVRRALFRTPLDRKTSKVTGPHGKGYREFKFYL